MSPEKVAIVGSRDYPHRQRVYDYVAALPYDTTVISGGAPGVDSWAEDAARERGLRVSVKHADWDIYGRAAGPIRNTAIVAPADRVVAFWDGKSPGTADTIRKARDAGLPVEVIGLDEYPEVASIAEKRGEKILASLQELRNVREQVLAKLHGEKP